MFHNLKGYKNFDKCSLKKVVYDEHVKVLRNGMHVSISSSSRKAGELAKESLGVTPSLTCPKLDELGITIQSDRSQDYRGYDTKVEALQNIRKIAGQTACASCEFAGMSAEDVANRRRATAEAEQRALIAEANLKALQTKVANGEAIIQDLPPEGGLYPRI